MVAGGCISSTPLLPGDAGVPFPDFAQAHGVASAACRAVITFTAEIRLSGQVAGEAFGVRMLSGFQRPASMRLVGLSPFGAPVFILAASESESVLYLQRDQRVLRGASATELLDATVGVALGPEELLAVLTGCVAMSPDPIGGRLHRNGWVAIDLADGSTVYLDFDEGDWRPRAALRGEWVVDYPPFPGTFPDEVVLRSTRQAVEVTARVAQFEANTPIDAAAFAVVVPDHAIPITLDELRAAGPLRDAGNAP